MRSFFLFSVAVIMLVTKPALATDAPTTILPTDKPGYPPQCDESRVSLPTVTLNIDDVQRDIAKLEVANTADGLCAMYQANDAAFEVNIQLMAAERFVESLKVSEKLLPVVGEPGKVPAESPTGIVLRAKIAKHRGDMNLPITEFKFFLGQIGNHDLAKNYRTLVVPLQLAEINRRATEVEKKLAAFEKLLNTPLPVDERASEPTKTKSAPHGKTMPI